MCIEIKFAFIENLITSNNGADDASTSQRNLFSATRVWTLKFRLKVARAAPRPCRFWANKAHCLYRFQTIGTLSYWCLANWTRRPLSGRCRRSSRWTNYSWGNVSARRYQAAPAFAWDSRNFEVMWLVRCLASRLASANWRTLMCYYPPISSFYGMS